MRHRCCAHVVIPPSPALTVLVFYLFLSPFSWQWANVYDIIKRPSLVLDQDAVAHLEQLLEAK